MNEVGPITVQEPSSSWGISASSAAFGLAQYIRGGMLVRLFILAGWMLVLLMALRYASAGSAEPQRLQHEQAGKKNQ
jgi:hypothetical protein